MTSPILVSVQEHSDSDSYIATKFDRRKQEAAMLDNCAEYLNTNRLVPFMATFFWDDEPICFLRSSKIDQTDERWRSMFEIISVFSSLNPVYCMGLIAFANKVQIGGELRDCICINTLARYGSETAVYPYHFLENGTVVFEDITAADESSEGEYPSFVAYSLASYAFAFKGFGRPSEVLKWLSCNGVTVKFFGDWNIDSINARMAHFPSIDRILEESDETERLSS